MPTHFLKMLADLLPLPEDDSHGSAYDAMEVDARSALISTSVSPDCALVFSEAACEHNFAAEDRELYLGTHECGDRKADDTDELYIELWATIDEEGDLSDFLMWQLVTLEATRHAQYPIAYCPFCGVHLCPFILQGRYATDCVDD